VVHTAAELLLDLLNGVGEVAKGANGRQRVVRLPREPTGAGKKQGGFDHEERDATLE